VTPADQLEGVRTPYSRGGQMYSISQNQTTNMPSRINKRECSRLLYLIASTILVALSGCSQHDASSILETGCQPPCWYHITPGETSIADALSIIENIPEVSKNSISMREDGTGSNSVQWVMGSSGSLVFVELTSSNDTVSTIGLSLNHEVTIKELMLAYGQPDVTGGFYGQGEGHWRRVFILFDQGVEASLIDQGLIQGLLMPDKWRLRPSDTVDYLFFFDPDIINSPQQEDWLLMAALWPDVEAFIAAGRPWEGYSTLLLQLVR